MTVHGRVGRGKPRAPVRARSRRTRGRGPDRRSPGPRATRAPRARRRAPAAPGRGSVEAQARGVVGRGAGNEVVGERLALALALVLAALGVHQAVERVVLEALVGAHGRVAREDHRLRQVADLGDVSGRVVGVPQVLVQVAVGIAERPQPSEPEGQRVVGVARAGAVAVDHQRSLPAGVVAQVGDEVGRRHHTADVGGDRFEVARIAVAEVQHRTVGRGLGDRAAHRVEARLGGEDLRLEQRRGRGIHVRGGRQLVEHGPVGRGGVGRGQAS